ncbi:MAG: efflux RND transporter permease subunit [Planctomycetes bacterium]|nr:efflux RND transporter permease subunit [Planctomycetota bacterium]
MTDPQVGPPPGPSLFERLLGAALRQPVVVTVLAVVAVGWGVLVAPFDLGVGAGARDPVPVDALPDTGDNQQIVFSEWPGRSPQDVEDQITYPLTAELLGVAGVTSVRSTSMFGFSSVFVIFADDVDFYWARARLTEALASLPPETLPDGVRPRLGPAATALGQVYWYTLEARDEAGAPVAAFDLHELRTIQDDVVRYALASVEGVAEVASIGGYVREYQVDVDPDAMRALGVTLTDVFRAVQGSNLDVGARTVEVNGAEFVVRGLGFLGGVEDLEQVVVGENAGVPITIRQIAQVAQGPALRRGALDRAGAEAVGGVVVVRHGANPLQVIERLRQRVAELAPGLPSRRLDDGRTARVTVRPFYDRTELIHETLDTLRIALVQQLAITAIVVLLMVAHLRSALLIGSLLPLGVIACFVLMKLVGVEANVVALAGIAIAIGTMVDTGIVLTENVLRHVDPRDTPAARLRAIRVGAAEVGGAVLTAVLTTVVGFLPVFAMEGPEGKLFTPLAWTKTFAILASIVIALFVIPVAAAFLLRPAGGRRPALAATGVFGLVGVALWYTVAWWAGAVAIGIAAARAVDGLVPPRAQPWLGRLGGVVLAGLLVVLLADEWQPLGVGRMAANRGFTAATLLVVLLAFWLLRAGYVPALRALLRAKAAFLAVPLAIVAAGAAVWLGAERLGPWLGVTGATCVALLAFSPLRAALAGFAGRGADRGRRLALGTALAGVAASSGWLAGGADLAFGCGALGIALGTALALVPVRSFARPGNALRAALRAVIGAALAAALARGLGGSLAAAAALATLALATAAAAAPARAAVRIGRLPAGVVALLFAVALGAGVAATRAALDDTRAGAPGAVARAAFPGLGREFMPPLDEGAFLLMPVTMAHASIGEALDVLQKQDRAIRAIPEVLDVVGKLGRVDSPLDPAPIAMIETVVTYANEYRLGPDGHVARFRFDAATGTFAHDGAGALIEDEDGRPLRQWRDHIRTPDDIWSAIADAARIPGTTTASKLGPIETRRVMLQTGMRAPIGVKVRGPDLASVERAGLAIAAVLETVPSVDARTVYAERVVGKPYLEIDIDRAAIARHGLSVRDVQQVIEVAIGGRPLTRTVEGRSRFPVRVRYLRELRDSIDELARILVPEPGGSSVPLGQLAELRYARGPQAIRGEDGFLTAYVTFDAAPGAAASDVVDACQRALRDQQASGVLALPDGVSYRFAGEYENQVRAEAKLRIVLPLALAVIFLLLYLQFGAVWSTCIAFCGVFVAWAGGFLMLGVYGHPEWFEVELFGTTLRELFQVRPVQLSVAVWVGFLALFGIATDDGVLMGTWLKRSFAERQPGNVPGIRAAVVAAAARRIRPALMTSATTILALLPVLTSRGRGSDVMLPMAIPSFGGMTVVLLTVFVTPVCWCAVEELRLWLRGRRTAG